MKERDALTLSAKLIASTTGWNDEAAEMLVETIGEWADAQAAAVVINQLCDTWQEPQRPTLGRLVSAYRAECNRRTPPRELEEAVCSPARGREIARENYAAECRRQGRDPNWPFFDRIGGKP